MYLHACVALAVACGTLEVTAPPAVDAGVVDAAEDAATPADAASVDAGDEEAAVARALPCGATSCEAGASCCVGNAGRACGAGCDASVYRFDCFAAADCVDEAKPTCCFEVATATCKATCSGHVLCASATECGGGPCVAANCTQPDASFLHCTKGGTETSAPPFAPQCQLN